MTDFPCIVGVWLSLIFATATYAQDGVKHATENTPAVAPAESNTPRTALLAAMQEVMGRLPGDDRRVDLQVHVEEEVDVGSYLRRLLTVQSEPNSRTPAYLCIPKSALRANSKVPAVLCLHPTDNRVGHQVVVGLGGRAGRQPAP